MKLESHLPQGTGPLHLAPMLDVVMLVVIFFLIGGSFVLHSGVTVDVPVSTSMLPVDSDAYVVTVSPPSVEGSRITFNGQPVNMAELKRSLELGRVNSRQVIILGDKQATLEDLLPIFTVAKSIGYDVAISTRTEEAQ
jgi:biopolymer transport protein ExbD